MFASLTNQSCSRCRHQQPMKCSELAVRWRAMFISCLEEKRIVVRGTSCLLYIRSLYDCWWVQRCSITDSFIIWLSDQRCRYCCIARSRMCVVSFHALVDQIQDVLFHHEWFCSGRVPTVGMAVRTDQPFLEVPRDVVVSNRRPSDVGSVCNQTHRCRTSGL